uniref:Uncharacterized mitochondrial protein AtMg00810-like n=1 Tax=Nicotiana tabacum TaxID=4097 RepID=A0A1S3YHW5_TOBAC|nr:PREDICTED: uncharacterized mitochondrial protein AtMg00810-like [Nicotiana tabacum]
MQNWHIQEMDVYNAFLQGDLDDEATKDSLHKAFKIKDLGELKFFLGMEFSRSSRGILYDKLTGNENDSVLEDKGQYQRLIGKLLYLTLTRPDIAYTVQTLSQFLQQPKNSHWDAAMRASCPNTRRSVSGFLVKYGKSLVSWKSKKQNIVSKSSAEAEYRSMASVVSEAVWLVGL